LLMLLVAVTAYGMPARAAVSAAILGMASGLWPIGWIILTAVFFYNLTVEAGQSRIIQNSISSLSGDRRLQAPDPRRALGSAGEGVARAIRSPRRSGSRGCPPGPWTGP